MGEITDPPGRATTVYDDADSSSAWSEHDPPYRTMTASEYRHHLAP
jgi:hypothetical protein